MTQPGTGVSLPFSFRRGTLFYESPVGAGASAPRLLLIAYNFPPDPAVGGLRWQEMARLLTEAGWGVDVITRDFQDVHGCDERRLERLPVGVRIFSVPDREPLLGRAQKIVWPVLRRLFRRRPSQGGEALTRDEVFQKQGARAFVRVYHAWIEFTRDEIWARSAAAVGRWASSSTRYVAVVTSGPPHMVHEAGRLLSVSTRVPHVVDMRDPWSLAQRLRESIASPLWIRWARKFESRALANATLVTMNTQAAAGAMRAAYPVHADKIDVVRNGADDEPLPPHRHDATFRLRFAGSIYLDRDPRIVFRAARRMITALKLTPEQFVIELFGDANRYAGTLTTQIAEEEDVASHVYIGGRMHRQETMEFLAGGTMLLSLPQDSDYAIPAKIYEYVRFESWLLILATPHSATAQVLRDSEADVIEPDDVDGMAAVLQMRYEQFRSGINPRPVGWDGRFDRRAQAEHFVHLLQQHVATVLPAVSGVSDSPAGRQQLLP